MPAALIDTGPIVAFFDESDNFCVPVREFMQGFVDPLVTTNHVITECSYLLSEWPQAQQDLMEWISDGAIRIAELPNQSYVSIAKIMRKYADAHIDLADATLIHISQELGINRILTIDSEFSFYKTLSSKGFRSLLPLDTLRKKKRKPHGV